MPYQFNPYTYSYDWYAEGTTPPKPDRSGEEYIPGYEEAYIDMFPGQPHSQAVGGVAQSHGNDGSITITEINGKPVGSSGNGSGSSSTSGDENAKRDAYEYLKRLFDSYGLSSLSPKILEFIQQGYGADTISLMLQDTSEYKQRFKGNEDRRKKGLAVLSPAEYLSLERSYRQILDSNGMPKGFYDSTDDYTSWISNDVSPAEIQDRVQIAARAVNNTDTGYLQSLRDYGLGQGDLIAASLDRERSLPVLQKIVREAEIGAEARRQGLTLSKTRAAYFESMGVDRGTAASAYQMIGEVGGTLQNLGDIYGDDSYGTDTLEDELLGRSGMASERRKRLQGRETGNFAGTSAINRNSLGGISRAEF